MQIPYAKKWQKETDKLRKIALDCYLTEEIKWGKSCFTFLKKNVAIVLKKPSEYPIPDELQAILHSTTAQKAAFQALTPGRRKSYIFHISSAKQARTRQARAERCVPMILSGRGFNEPRG
jgi:uncharacterized protein YdeI (YjbR/CyaY-like superfamily)